MVAQGIYSEYPINATVAFDSQRLQDAYKAKGVLELHVLQKEAAQLKTQYQSHVPLDEMTVRQMQHSQFHINPNKAAMDLNSLYHSIKQTDYFAATKNAELAAYLNYLKVESASGLIGGSIKQDRDLITNAITASSINQIQKPPLQQQLMQHRLLQQKRQIFQKQVALESSLSRRQMLRQQSYKIAQQTQILPPLPLSDIESKDLMAFQAVVEGNSDGSMLQANNLQSPSASASGSPKLMKTSHMKSQQEALTLSLKSLNSPQQTRETSGDCWNALPVSMQTCQISEHMNLDNWNPSQASIFQVSVRQCSKLRLQKISVVSLS